MSVYSKYKDIIQVRNLKDNRDFMIFKDVLIKTQLIFTLEENVHLFHEFFNAKKVPVEFFRFTS
jgi:hypothetical protein